MVKSIGSSCLSESESKLRNIPNFQYREALPQSFENNSRINCRNVDHFDEIIPLSMSTVGSFSQNFSFDKLTGNPVKTFTNAII